MKGTVADPDRGAFIGRSEALAANGSTQRALAKRYVLSFIETLPISKPNERAPFGTAHSSIKPEVSITHTWNRSQHVSLVVKLILGLRKMKYSTAKVLWPARGLESLVLSNTCPGRTSAEAGHP